MISNKSLWRRILIENNCYVMLSRRIEKEYIASQF